MNKAFKITYPHQHIQERIFPPGVYVFQCNVKHHLNALTFAMRDVAGVWHEFELPCEPDRWVHRARRTFAIAEQMTAFSLCSQSASVMHPVYVQFPLLENEATATGVSMASSYDYIETLQNSLQSENCTAELMDGLLTVSAMTADSASATLSLDEYAISKRFTISKNKKGGDGADGVDGTDGTDGNDGENGQDALSVEISKFGHFKLTYKQLDADGNLLPTPLAVPEIVGGVDILGTMVVQCRAKIFKGTRDVTGAVQHNGNIKWRLNDVHQLSYNKESILNIHLEHCDGVSDIVEFEFDDANAHLW